MQPCAQITTRSVTISEQATESTAGLPVTSPNAGRRVVQDCAPGRPFLNPGEAAASDYIACGQPRDDLARTRRLNENRGTLILGPDCHSRWTSQKGAAHHGVSKPVVLDATLDGAGVNPI